MRIAVIAAAVLIAVCSVAYAADIVTVPTANQLRAGEIDVAYYHLGLDLAPPAPQSLEAQTLYFGLTDQIELDVHRYDPDGDRESVLVNASFCLMRETETMPDLVIGGRNLLEEKTTDNPFWDSDDRSWSISAAKTFSLPASWPPKPPLVRVHLSLGTEDPSLLAEERHDGLFGGIQAKLTPEIGLVALQDSQDLITGLTYTPSSYPNFTLKGGTYGDHWWVGLSYAK